MRVVLFAMLVGAMTWAGSAVGAGADTNYLPRVKAYADAMIKDGRDTYGEEKSPLFASALDRKTMKLGSRETFTPISLTVRDQDRALGGSNPQQDMGLYSLLYDLTAATGDKQYAGEADKALAFFFTRCQDTNTGFMAWGEHLYWHFEQEKCSILVEKHQNKDTHELCGEWPLWDAGYRLAPDASWRFALGLWDHQVGNKTNGNFSRHAPWGRHATGLDAEYPRYAGQMIVTWADAYGRPENAKQARRGELLDAISVVVGRMEANAQLSTNGYLPAASSKHERSSVWLDGTLEMARCMWKAAPCVEKDRPELAKRMRDLALQQDRNFLKPPAIANTNSPLAGHLAADTRLKVEAWATGYGRANYAMYANLCNARYEQLATAQPDLAAQYKALVLATADWYPDPNVSAGITYRPDAFAAVIDMMLDAYEITKDRKYLERAQKVADAGIGLFLDDGLPLPKATNKDPHYEAITGGPDFMLALLRLDAARR